MRKWKRFGVISLVVVVLIFAAAVVAALALEPAAPAATDAYSITWKVIASGGATMSSPSYTMMGTVGQPVTGTSASSNYSVLSGYWYGFQELIRTLFLPIVLR